MKTPPLTKRALGRMTPEQLDKVRRWWSKVGAKISQAFEDQGRCGQCGMLRSNGYCTGRCDENAR